MTSSAASGSRVLRLLRISGDHFDVQIEPGTPITTVLDLKAAIAVQDDILPPVDLIALLELDESDDDSSSMATVVNDLDDAPHSRTTRKASYLEKELDDRTPVRFR